MSNTSVLAGHRSLIVGGGSGIGYATAELLLAAGATVTIAGRNTDKLQTAAAQLRPIATAGGGAVAWVGCDVMNGADVRKAVEVADGGVRLDSAVTVPGGGHFRPVLGYPDALFSEEVDMNVRPQYLVLKYAGLAMVRCGGGSIVAVSSTAAKFSSRYLASYCAGKAAVEHLVRVAADELGEKNIRVNAVGPGLTRTDATAGMFGNAALLDRFLAQQPLRRGGEALDQAQAIRFLVGPESSWITGQCLTVDGGNTLRSFPDCTDMARSILGDGIFATVDRGEAV
jgi:NAD(P)-dependent dehydrogenase (short-subunit alcohol dehydrogenase family)